MNLLRFSFRLQTMLDDVIHHQDFSKITTQSTIPWACTETNISIEYDLQLLTGDHPRKFYLLLT